MPFYFKLKNFIFILYIPSSSYNQINKLCHFDNTVLNLRLQIRLLNNKTESIY